jgi:hypothetical protein
VLFPNGARETPPRKRGKVFWSLALAFVGAAFAVWLMMRLPGYLAWSMSMPVPAGIGLGALLALVAIGCTLRALADVWR